MIWLITDRTQADLDRRNALARKGWANMTAAEKAEWTGDPLLNTGANLIPRGENHSAGTSVKYAGASTVVTAAWDGTYIYAIILIGDAAKYAGKTMTLSLDGFTSSKGDPLAALYWHDGNGSEWAGGPLSGAGSVTFTLTENTNGRENLALYLYATTETEVSAGAFVKYEGLMLETGSDRHEYVPYYDVLPTAPVRGSYNYSDLNRVEAAVKDLAARSSIALETKTDWAMWDVPTKSDMDRYISNIASIRRLCGHLKDTPEAPTSMAKLTYSAANDIEKILVDANHALDYYYRSGEIYSGEA